MSGKMKRQRSQKATEIKEDDAKFLPNQIHKVAYSLRRVNELEYEPLFLSIGPYHYKANERFEDIDKCKELYFESMLARMRDVDDDQRLVEITKTCLEEEMKSIEGETRARYASRTRNKKLESSEDFVRMMTLDGCFIIELLRKLLRKTTDSGQHYKTDHDPIFKINFIRCHIFRDLILFENQLPLPVLEKLFQLTKDAGEEVNNFVELALSVLPELIHCDKIDISWSEHLKDSPHLLGLAYIAYLLPSPLIDEKEVNAKTAYDDIKSATALCESGVEFKRTKSDHYKGFGVIEFTDDGVLEIPHLAIYDDTETILRNFIAYEQYSEQVAIHRVTDFVIFMDFLINTSKDVELLRHSRIIENGIGDDEKVTKIFNNISLSISYCPHKLYYAHKFNEINEYCAKRRHAWMANLWRNYFNSPWSLISFLAALMLLLLTVTQTIFSVLSYVNPKP